MEFSALSSSSITHCSIHHWNNRRVRPRLHRQFISWSLGSIWGNDQSYDVWHLHLLYVRFDLWPVKCSVCEFVTIVHSSIRPVCERLDVSVCQYVRDREREQERYTWMTLWAANLCLLQWKLTSTFSQHTRDRPVNSSTAQRVQLLCCKVEKSLNSGENKGVQTEIV